MNIWIEKLEAWHELVGCGTVHRDLTCTSLEAQAVPGVSGLLPWLPQREGSLTFGMDFLEIKIHHGRDLPQDPTQVIAHKAGWRQSEGKSKFCPRGTTNFGVLATNLSMLQLMFKLTRQDTCGSINLKIPTQLSLLCTVKSTLLWVPYLVRFQVSVNSQGENACTVAQMIFQSSLCIRAWRKNEAPISES